MPPGADHKNAALCTPQICLQEMEMKEDHVSNLFKIWVIKHAQTDIGFDFDCRLCVLLSTILIITLPIFTAFFAYAHMDLAYFVKISSVLAFSLR